MFNTLCGVRADFGAAVAALVAGQTGVALALASLAPIVLVWNVSTTDHVLTVLFNGLLFGLAAAGGQALLRRHYRPLFLRDARHRSLLKLWFATYMFVGIQMGWVLRPFVGEPGKPAHFIREDAWGNAYVVLVQLVTGVLKR